MEDKAEETGREREREEETAAFDNEDDSVVEDEEREGKGERPEGVRE